MDFRKPWWDTYRKRKYKPRNYLTMEMIIRKSFAETFKEYLASCSIAGVKQIANPGHGVFVRFFWLGIFCMSLSIVIYFLLYTWVSILTKPLVVTGESYTYPIHDIDFPAVALCNINRISRKALKKFTVEAFPKLSKFNTTMTNLEYFFLDMGRLIDFEYDETRSHVKLIEAFAMTDFSDQTMEIMKAMAPSCEEMLKKCMWGGKEVDCNSIFQVRRTFIGHCCVFNYVLEYNSADSPQGSLAAVKRQTVPGLPSGLRVIIDPMLEDYAYPMSFREGFEVLIFDPIHFADPTGGRVLQRTVQPNQAQFFQLSSIKQVASSEVRKYPLKTRKCLFRDEYPKEFKNMYSYSACLERCRIQSVQSLCKCTPFFLPTGTSKQTKICTLKNLKCLNKYKEKLQYLYPFGTDNTAGLEQELADSLYCPNCLPDCELTQHFTKAYNVPIPHEEKNDLYMGFKHAFIDGMNLTNKCVIYLYQPTTSGILHRLDVISYWFEILSNIGGFAGMLMGIGIYTIVEVIYFLLIRFTHKIYYNYLKHYSS